MIFASGSGSNFQSIIDNIQSGRLDAKITGLITNRDQIGAISIAKLNGIPYQVINKKDFSKFKRSEISLIFFKVSVDLSGTRFNCDEVVFSTNTLAFVS